LTKPHPTFDPELYARLRQAGPAFFPPLALETIADARRASVAAVGGLTDDDIRRNGAIEFEEVSVAGPSGAPNISLLICKPAHGLRATSCIYYIHGGGMVVGGNRLALSLLLDWVEEFKVTGVSVEYRVAPENPHPAPVEDCYAGLLWTNAHARELGIDPRRLLIAGPSAGGGLAAGVALMARDRGGPQLLAQMLMCPMLDDRNNTVSSYQIDGIGLWPRQSNITGWTALLGEARGTNGVSPYAAPARADFLGGLPPAFIDAGSMEVFRDEAADYASRIWKAGGDAELHIWNGGFHGFDIVFPDAALSRAARSARRAWLSRVLTNHS
jgi:acetyl esterase/lipase